MSKIIPNGTYRIIPQANRKVCLSISTQTNNLLRLSDIGQGDDSHCKWRVVRDPNGEGYYIVNEGADRMLEEPSGYAAYIETVAMTTEVYPPHTFGRGPPFCRWELETFDSSLEHTWIRSRLSKWRFKPMDDEDDSDDERGHSKRPWTWRQDSVFTAIPSDGTYKVPDFHFERLPDPPAES